MSGLKVLVACEFSGTVREAFAKRGHDAWSCDLEPTDVPGNHYQGSVLDILDRGGVGFDDCTSTMHLSNSYRK
jgi:hypothetical protein